MTNEQTHCQCKACINGNIHDSDCSVHNGDALPEGPCDCRLAALAQPVQHREGHWCADLTCSRCYGADFRFKHSPHLPVQEPSTVKDYLTNETGPVQSDLLVRCETEMRYAGWINAEADNPQRQELYIAVCKALATPPLPVQEQLNKADAEWNKADAEFNKAYAEWSKADAEVVRIQKLIKEQALKEKNT